MEEIILIDILCMAVYVAFCYLVAYFVYGKNLGMDSIYINPETNLKEPQEAVESTQIDFKCKCDCGYVFSVDDVKVVLGYGVDFFPCPNCGRDIHSSLPFVD